jgi:hypothetical protein
MRVTSIASIVKAIAAFLTTAIGAHAQVPAVDTATCVPHACSTDGPGLSRPLRAGEVVFALRNRTFLIPSDVVDGFRIQPTIGVRWGLTDFLEFDVEAQTVDNAGPGRQAGFRVNRTLGVGAGSGNFLQEATFGIGVRLWRSRDSTMSLRLSGAFSKAVRSYFARDTLTGAIDSVSGNRRDRVKSWDVRFLVSRPRWRASLGSFVAHFPEDNAMYVRRLSRDSTHSFGTTAGPRAELTLALAPALSLWGSAFAPLTGKNTIVRASGLPARTLAYDVGATLHVNRALDLDLFVSNALGNSGPLAMVADREYRAIGTSAIFRPWPRDGASATFDASFADDGSLPGIAPSFTAARAMRRPPHSAILSATAGAQGALASLDVTPVDGLVLSAYLDNVSGTKDEGELGVSARARVFTQSLEVPTSLSVTITGARTNNVMVNLLAGRADEFRRLGLEKSGFDFGDENEAEGKVYVVTASIVAERTFAEVLTLWSGPSLAVAQRRGVQVAGVTAGASGRMSNVWWLVAEGGADVGDKGNMLTDSSRLRRLSWLFGFIRQPDSESRLPVGFRLYVTNRVGDSPFHALRVRANGNVAIGAGLHLPIGRSR